MLHLQENGVNKLKALRGVDGQTLWELASYGDLQIGPPPYHEAAGDINGDGIPEIVIPLYNGRVAGIAHDGTVLWISERLEFGGGEYAGAPVLANLDGFDGVEILVGRTVLSGQTGLVLSIGAKDRGQNTNPLTSMGYPYSQELSTVADLDGDGYPEIIAGNTAYRLTRNAGVYALQVVWSWEQMGMPEIDWDLSMPDGFSAVGDLNKDGLPEIAYVSAGYLCTMDPTGHLLRGPIHMSTTCLWGGPPTIADLDGDGAVEIIVASETALTAYTANLTQKWSKSINDWWGGMMGVSAADLDGDGILEVMHRDFNKFYILNGKTGEELFSVDSGCGTATQYPVPADVNGDGTLEVILTSPSPGPFTGMVVFGNPLWTTGSKIWNQYDYHVTNVDADAAIPYPEYPQWRLHNKTRTNISRIAKFHPQTNLSASLLRATQQLGATTLIVRLGNGGETYIPPDTQVALFADDLPVAIQPISERIKPGSYFDLEFIFAQPGLHRLQIRADDDGNGTGAVIECDELDNITTILETFNSSTDLLVSASDIQFTPSATVNGAQVKVTVGIVNAGTQQVSDALIRINTIRQNVTSLLDERRIAVQPGNTTTYSIAWTATEGFTLFQIVADPGNEIAEYSETNNAAVKGITVGEAAPQPNLTLSILDTPVLDEDGASSLLTGHVAVLVQNVSGRALDHSTDLILYEDLNGNGTLDGESELVLAQAVIPALLAFGSVEQTLTVSELLSYPEARLAIYVDSGNLIQESDETDNNVLLRPFCQLGSTITQIPYREKWAANFITYSVPVVFDFVQDPEHIPDLIFARDNAVTCIRGDTGALNWNFTDTTNAQLTRAVHGAFADLDDDGQMEIAFPRKGGGVFAVDETGHLEWSNKNYTYQGDRGGVSIANLDGQGNPEVIFGDAVFDGATGKLLWTNNRRFGTGANRGATSRGDFSVAADLDQDGIPELIAGTTAYDLVNNNGTWTHTIKWNRTDLVDGFPAVADFDGDGKGEVVLVSSGKVYLLNDDGSTLWGPIYLDGVGGPPSVGDADMDGRPDVAVAAAGHLYLINADGNIMWQSATQDYTSETTGSTFFDLEGDGAVEVVYNDENFLRIYDGRTGIKRLELRSDSSTATEYPIIADVDGDREAELIILSPDSTKIRALGSIGHRWVGTRPLWNQHAYHITNINDDGRIPLIEPASWKGQNSFRSNTINIYGEEDLPNAVAGSIWVTQQGDPAQVILTFIVANASLVPLAELPWAVYDGDPSAGGVAIATGSATNLSAGQFKQVSTAWQAPSEGNKTIYLVVDPGDVIQECNEADNSRNTTVVIDYPPPASPDLVPSPESRFSANDIQYADQPLEIHAIIENQRGYNAGTFAVAVYEGNPASGGTRLASTTVSGARGLETVNCALILASGLPEGWHDLYLVADADLQIAEYSEANNTLNNAVFFHAPPAHPDLIVERITNDFLTESENTLLLAGSVECVIKNISPRPVVGAFMVAIHSAEGTSNDQLFGQQRFTQGLGSFESLVVTLPASGYLPFRSSPLTISVDVLEEVTEEREDNNRLPVSTCRRDPQYGFNPQLQWQANIETYSVPALGDFVPDAAAVPDLIFSSRGDLIYCIRGDNGVVNWTFDGTGDAPYRVASWGVHPAYGDLDHDGKPEVVFPRSGGGLFALNAEDGSKVWTTTCPANPDSTAGAGYRGGSSIADLDGDGNLEVIFMATIVSHDGAHCWTMSTGNKGANAGAGTKGHLSIVADINLDGKPDILAGPTVYTPRKDQTGNWVFDVLWSRSDLKDAFPAVGNFDNDANAEVVLVTSGKVYLLDDDGQTLWSNTVTGAGGPPTIGDVDGDGWPEVGVAGSSDYSLFETNGSAKWRVVIHDASSNTTGSSIFDFDGDGRQELIYNDEQRYFVFDGPSGLSRWDIASGSGTMTEYPIVADINGDGETELLVVSPTAPSIRCYGDSNHRWVATRPLWNQHTYHVTNIDDDGNIPLQEKPSWIEHNTYRCNLPTNSKSHLAQANLTAGYLRVDNALVPDYAKFTARVGNAGEKTAAAPFVIAFYRGDPGAGGALMDRVTQTTDLQPGESVDITVFWPQPAMGTVDIWVVADESAVVGECNEEDNFHHALLTVAEDVPTEYPDLFVDPATTAVIPADPVAGQPAVLGVTVSNIGKLAAPATEVTVVLASVGGSPHLETLAVPPLNVGQTMPLNIHWDTLGLLSGSYAVDFIIDPSDAIRESAEGNNAATLFVTLAAPTKPDLEITDASLTISAISPIQGDPVTLTATMLNRGTEAIGPELRFTAAGSPVLETAYAGVLAHGGSASFSVPLETVDWTGSVTLTAAADPNGRLEEGREDNNLGQAVLNVIPSGVTVVVAADREQYSADEEVMLTITVTGTAGQERSGEVRTIVMDEAGGTLVELDFEPMSLSGDIPVTFTRTWNTATHPPQTLTARATYFEEETARARGRDAFELRPSTGLAAALTTDQPSYGPQADVLLEAHFTNTGLNAPLENLTGVLQIISPSGTLLVEIPITTAYLPPGGVAVFNAVWNTGTVPAGLYEARTALSDPTGVVTATAEIPFEIRGSTGQGLAGDLSCQPQDLDRGAPVTWTYQITNLGNTDLVNLPVQVRFYLDGSSEPAAVWDRTHTLTVGASTSATETVPTAAMVPGSHIATLVALLPSGEKLLDTAGFTLHDKLALECALTLQPGVLSAHESLTATLTVHNLAYALPYENGALRLTITGPGYGLTDALALPLVPGGGSHTVNYPWNAAQYPPGAYTVLSEWLDANQGILCSQTRPFTVTSSAENGAGLAGDLAFDPTMLERGDPLQMTYHIMNSGNAALDGLPVEVRLSLDGVPGRTWQAAYTLPINGSANYTEALNSRTMTAGTYTAVMVALLPAGEVILDTAGFTLHDRVFLTCQATASDTTLSAHEDLHAALTVALDADSMPYENGTLVLTITGAAYTFTETLAVPPLAAGASHTVPYTWNAAQHAPGDYRLTAEFKDGAGTVRCTSTLDFSIVSSHEDGAGLAGTLTLDPVQVIQGDSVYTTATCLNDGNADLPDLRLKITILNAADQVIETREYPLPLTIGQTDQALDDWSTAAYPPGNYRAVLTAELGEHHFPLDQKSFEVLAGGGFTVDIQAGTRPNILIWAVCAAKGCTDPNPYFLTTTLTNAAIPYTVVYDEAAFKTQYRTGLYTAVVLYRPDPKVQETYEELASGVYAGTGLFLIQDHPDENPKLREACGVHLLGKHKTGAYTVQVTDSPVSTASTLALSGLFINLTLEGAAPFGMATDGSPYPVLTHHLYGAGMAVMAAFNTESIQTQAMADLYLSILRSIGARTVPAPYAVLPVRITVINTGTQEETVTLQLTLPPNTQLLFPAPQPQIPDPCCTWSLTIPASSSVAVEFLWRLGGAMGDYALQADLYRVGAAQPEASDTYTVTVAVEADGYGTSLLEEIAYLLSQTQVQTDRDTLAGIQAKVQAVIGRTDHERNIKDLTQAFKMAGTLSSVDSTRLKTLLAEAIKLEGIAWTGGAQ